MTKRRFILRNVFAIAICLAGITMLSGCIDDENGDGDYTIQYRPGAHSSGQNYSQSKKTGEPVTLRDVTYTRSGFTQAGWSTSEDGDSWDYDLHDDYWDDSNVTLYPYWEDENSGKFYTVWFDPGLYGIDDGYEDDKWHGEDYKIPVWTFYRPGYRQSGWSLTQEGSKDYELEGVVKLNRDFTLYPVWTLGVWAVNRPFDDCFFNLREPFYTGAYAFTSTGSGTTKNAPGVTLSTGEAIYRKGYYYQAATAAGKVRDTASPFDVWIDWDMRSKDWYVVSAGLIKKWWYLNGGVVISSETSDIERKLENAQYDNWNNLKITLNNGSGFNSGGRYVRTGSGTVVGRDCAIFRLTHSIVVVGFREFWIDKQTGLCLKVIIDEDYGDDFVKSETICTSLKLGSEVNPANDPPILTDPDGYYPN